MKVYTQTNCPYCEKLKEGLDAEGIPYSEVNIADEKNIEETEWLFKLTQKNLVPVIFSPPYILVPTVSFQTIDEAIMRIKQLPQQKS